MCILCTATFLISRARPRAQSRGAHGVSGDKWLDGSFMTNQIYQSTNTQMTILGDPGAVSRVDKMFVVKVYCKIETSPWALTLTEPVPEAFEYCLLLIGQKKNFLANQRREAAG